MTAIYRIISFVLLLCLCGNQPLFSQWNFKTQTFISKKYNLQWDLSGLGNWDIINSEQMPESIIFCGRMQDEGVVVLILTIDESHPVSDIWEGADEFIEGFISSQIKQSFAFPGIQQGEVQYEKCYFQFKKALRFGVPIYMNDARLGTDKPVPYLYAGYAFTKGNSFICPAVLFPGYYIEKNGTDIIEVFFKKVSYADIMKETD